MVWVRVGVVKARVGWLGLVWAWFVSGVGVARCGYAQRKGKFGVRVDVVTNRGAVGPAYWPDMWSAGSRL